MIAQIKLSLLLEVLLLLLLLYHMVLCKDWEQTISRKEKCSKFSIGYRAKEHILVHNT